MNFIKSRQYLLKHNIIISVILQPSGRGSGSHSTTDRKKRKRIFQDESV